MVSAPLIPLVASPETGAINRDRALLSRGTAAISPRSALVELPPQKADLSTSTTWRGVFN